MHGIDHGKGTQTEVALRQRLGEHVCVLRWTDLTTCDVSASSGALICQIHEKEMIHLLDDGLDICIRCGGRSRQLCIKKIKMMFLN